VIESGPPVWHNTARPTDVDDNGVTTGSDALLIINYLNAFPAGTLPSGSPPPFYDVVPDNAILPSDALEVINVINGGGGTGEGESAGENASLMTASPLSPSAVDEFFAHEMDDQAVSRKKSRR
jgi:hypothetical protein